MCGIHGVLLAPPPRPGSTSNTSSENGQDQTTTWDVTPLLHRGPDMQGHIALNDDGGSVLYAAVLHMRGAGGGEGDWAQPKQNDVAVMVFNGEIYNEETGQDDTSFLFEKLCSLSTNEERVAFLDSVNGEWAVILYDKRSQQLLFGTDKLARRSLLFHAKETCLVLSSCALSRRQSDFAHNEQEIVEWNEVSVANMHVACIGHDGHVNITSLIRSVHPTHPPPHDRNRDIVDSLTLAISRRIAGLETFGILFSGSVDCMCVAALAHLCCLNNSAEIVLINVSFDAEVAPDRISSRAAMDELRRCFPSRNWKFLPVDVTVEEVMKDQAAIRTLLLPKRSVMDFNLGSVMFYASKYCPAHVRALLSGAGADELFGGYGRHRTAFTRGGWPALHEEMDLDLRRLPQRNNARDDRCVAAFAHELRTPFLDDDVVALALVTREANMDFTLPPGQGDKKVIRHIVAKCGLHESANRVKKAMQFGSRVSKLFPRTMDGEDDVIEIERAS